MLSRRRFLLSCACCSASIPPGLFAQTSSAPPLAVTPLAEGVWRHTTWKLLPDGTPFPSSGIIVRGARKLLLVDTTWPTDQMAPLLDQTMALAGGLPVELVVTHAHDDRMSGVEIARQRGVRSLAHVLTQADAPSRDLPLADETWRGRRKRLDLGGRMAELYYPGRAHTRDNVVVFAAGVDVLFGGCQVRSGTSSQLGNVADAVITAWPGATRQLIRRYRARARIVVPGHGEPGGPELLDHTLELAKAAAARSEQR
jgi:glyoxylase-like metal-dependent hydrolase (beta-lactamase superfamily II)